MRMNAIAASPSTTTTMAEDALVGLSLGGRLHVSAVMVPSLSARFCRTARGPWPPRPGCGCADHIKRNPRTLLAPPTTSPLPPRPVCYHDHFR
jgi:hypothetical protein